ncbi:isochorismatase family cysteine hydrolase [Alteribacillus bidgolensis]|uniref:Nicotinamidase-related amidase n=1 Tax=Alteribacillus bidgolensis TaxID=930129 RepID=A0A1G8EKU3_9BACI|nr:isochorismatase family cysteine hydrolase [Alteribacillus bidgolensis]SDH70535.1 Nicotinamidase-related amidase [Alteribacillus bidgolensis]
MAEDLPHIEEKASVALLIIDMINDMEFEDSEKIFPQALRAAENIANLKKRAKQHDIPVIYVNDNYGRWQSDFKELVNHCKQDNVKGKPITELVEPEDDDYFVLKPQFSAFFATPLDLLLDYLEVKTLIITGVAGNMCIQFTANDAYMRHYRLLIPSDGTASNQKKDNDQALDLMSNVLKADVSSSSTYDFIKIIKEASNYYSQKRG